MKHLKIIHCYLDLFVNKDLLNKLFAKMILTHTGLCYKFSRMTIDVCVILCSVHCVKDLTCGKLLTSVDTYTPNNINEYLILGV